MKAFLAKHKLLVICLVALVIVTVAAVIGITGYKRASEIKSLIGEGDRFLSDLDYDSAIACYNQALAIDPKNKNANLALAGCYTASGKTDHAIDIYRGMIENDKRAAEAYVGLAELYIANGEPDRARELMDEAAENVKISKIEDVYTLTHPDKPEIDTKPGSYSERIKIELSATDPSCQIFFTLDGSDPTSESTPYTYPIVLPNGETEVKSITVNSSGFSSDVSSSTYNIEIEDKVIEPKDEKMKELLLLTLGRSYEEPIYNDDIESIISLCIIGNNYIAINKDDNIVFEGQTVRINGYAYYTDNSGRLKSLEDIAALPFLETLIVAYQSELDISALSQSKSLKKLSLIGNRLDGKDIHAIAGLANLEELCLGWNELSDVSALEKLTNLTSLGLWSNTLSDISPLKNLTKLEYLDISNNRVRDISPVEKMDALEELWIYNNAITVIEPATKLDSIKVLMLTGNNITDAQKLRKIYPRLSRIDEDLLGLTETEPTDENAEN